MTSESVRKLSLGAADAGGEFELGKAEPLAPKLDLHRYRAGHEAPAKFTKARHWLV